MRLRRYHEISADLEREIHSGASPAGSYLPSERELSLRYSVNRATVRRALALLTEKGLVEVRPGRGALVREHGPGSNGSAAHPLLALVAYASAGSPLVLDVFHSAQLAAERAGYDLLFYSTRSDSRFESERREAAWLEHCLSGEWRG
jgi:DNA-binding FadR family transcriptional regulator